MNWNQSILQHVSKRLRGTSPIDYSWCLVGKNCIHILSKCWGSLYKFHTFYSEYLKSVVNKKIWSLGVLILGQIFFSIAIFRQLNTILSPSLFLLNYFNFSYFLFFLTSPLSSWVMESPFLCLPLLISLSYYYDCGLKLFCETFAFIFVLSPIFSKLTSPLLVDSFSFLVTIYCIFPSLSYFHLLLWHLLRPPSPIMLEFKLQLITLYWIWRHFVLNVTTLCTECDNTLPIHVRRCFSQPIKLMNYLWIPLSTIVIIVFIVIITAFSSVLF